MIIKNVKPTTTVETILKALDPFAYLDERNVRLVKAKPPGAKCFCFVDMDSHEVLKKYKCTYFAFNISCYIRASVVSVQLPCDFSGLTTVSSFIASDTFG